MCIALDEENAICMTKYNIGDKTELPIANGVATVNAGSGSCASSSTRYCCWKGTTSISCDSANGDYSGCTRTVCDWRAANVNCYYLTYLGKSWRLPTKREWEIINSQINDISVGQGTNGLMLCDYSSGYSSAYCDYAARCAGSYSGSCYPGALWSSDLSGELNYNTGLQGGALMKDRLNSVYYTGSVRCVSDL